MSAPARRAARSRAAMPLPLPNTAGAYISWAGVMLLMAGLIAVQIWISLAIAQTRQEIVILQREYAFIEQANSEMLWKISQYTSLEYVQREARRAGFVPALRPSYREVQLQPALNLTGEPVMPLTPETERFSFLAEPDAGSGAEMIASAWSSLTPAEQPEWITLVEQRLAEWGERTSQGLARLFGQR